jgi:hypothetical protein
MIKEREITNAENVKALNLFFNTDASRDIKVIDTKIVDDKVIAIIEIK